MGEVRIETDRKHARLPGADGARIHLRLGGGGTVNDTRDGGNPMTDIFATNGRRKCWCWKHNAEPVRSCLICGGTGWTYPDPPARDRATGTFDGPTFDRPRDGTRLRGALDVIRITMLDGAWHTLAELSAAAGCTESAASARIRDLRKTRFGAYVIEAEYVRRGLWRYRMTDV